MFGCSSCAVTWASSMKRSTPSSFWLSSITFMATSRWVACCRACMIAPMPPPGHLGADGVALLREEFVGQQPAHRGLGRREAQARLGACALAADFQHHVAEPHVLVGKQPGGFGDPLFGDKGAVAAAQILQQKLVVENRELGVPARDERRLGKNLGLLAATDHVLAGRQGDTREFHLAMP